MVVDADVPSDVVAIDVVGASVLAPKTHTILLV